MSEGSGARRHGLADEQIRGPGPSEHLAGPFVDLVGDASELLRRDLPQVGALGEVVAQQPVHDLVGTALSRRVGVAEEHASAGLLADLLVHR